MLLFLTAVRTDEGHALLTELYGRYRDGLFKCALHFVGREQDAEDIVHDAFCAAARYEEKLLAGTEVFRRRFLFACTRHRAMTFARKQSRLVLVDEPRFGRHESADAELPFLEDDGPLLEKAEAAVKALAPPYSDVLYLYLEGCTVLQTAQILGVKPDTVRKQLYRAKQQLRKAVLEEEGGNEI